MDQAGTTVAERDGQPRKGGCMDPTRRLNDMLCDIDAMLSYATSTGKAMSPDMAAAMVELYAQQAPTPPGVAASPKDPSAVMALVMKVHGLLGQLVAPATPISIRNTEPVGGGLLVRNAAINLLVVMALGSLLLFMLTSIGIRTDWDVADSMLSLLNLLACAGLGAGFYSLWAAHPYIRDRTFDPQYNQLYIVRYVLGLAAGVILGYFGTNMFTGDPAAQAGDPGGQPGNLAVQLGPGVLAVVGGYAAEAVAQILQRLADTLVTLVRGSNADVLAAREQEIKVKSEQERARERDETLRKLYKAKDAAATAGAPPQVAQELQVAIDSLLV